MIVPTIHSIVLLLTIGLLSTVAEAGIQRCQHSLQLPEQQQHRKKTTFRDRSRIGLNMTSDVKVPQTSRELRGAIKLTVDTVITVLCPTSGGGGGGGPKPGDCVTREAIGKQLDTLNDAYNPYSIGFRLKQVRYVYHDLWFQLSVGRESVSTDAQTMMETLRVGDRKTLNVVFKSLEGISP